MKIYDTVRMLITTLSPVHVGTGESYEPTNYVIEDDFLHEFDTGAAMEALSAADRDALLAISNRKPNTELIEALQRFFHERRERLMGYAVKRIPVLPGVAGLYAKRIGQTASLEASGNKILNRLEIDRTSFNPVTLLPVLFGSSLKGAIRTALLDEVNGGKPAREQKGLHEFQGRLFKYRDPTTRRLTLEQDPMRLVQLADAAWTGDPGFHAAQVHLAVNRKKAPVVDEQGNLRKSKADELYQILECVPPWRYRAFSGQISVRSVDGLENRHRDKLPTSDLRFDLSRIAQACNAFYEPILEGENRLLRERKYLDDGWNRSIERLLDVSAKKRVSGRAFLLRVGRHSGAESVTVSGARNGHIKIILGKDPITKQQNLAYESEARTLWLASDDKDQMDHLLPFGWLLVELEPMGEVPHDWAELEEICEPNLETARAISARIRKKEVELAHAREDYEARRREEAEKERLAAEESIRQQREAAERQLRLAAMTPNLRRVEGFKADCADRAKQLRGKLDRQNTDYHQRAQKLMNDALEGEGWSPDEKRAVADAIAEWLPKVVERMDKDAMRKLKLSALRAES